MAARKPGKVAAPAKIKLRKNHGPKRKMFHCWDQTTRIHFAQAGVLSKYSNFESFSQSVGSKGIRKFISELWEDFIRKTGTDKAKQKEYFANIKDNADRVERECSKPRKITK